MARPVEELRGHPTAKTSAWYCWVITERQRSIRRAFFSAEPFVVSGTGGMLAPREVTNLPLGPLRKLVVAKTPSCSVLGGGAADGVLDDRLHTRWSLFPRVVGTVSAQ